MDASGAGQLRHASLLRCLTGAGGSAETAVLRRLHVTHARALRAAHPRFPLVVAAADWAWSGSAFSGHVQIDVCRGRRGARVAAHFAAAIPRAACGVLLNLQLDRPKAPATPAAAAAAAAFAVPHALCAIRALPPTLRVVEMKTLDADTTRDFQVCVAELCGRLHGLRDLTLGYGCSTTVLAAAPPTLCRLTVLLPPRWDGARLDRFTQLFSLEVCGSTFDDAALASAPPSLVRLLASNTALTAAARFTHLPRLRTLTVYGTRIGDAALASMARTLVLLWAPYTALSADARFDHLPLLHTLHVSATRFGDAALASVTHTLARLKVCNTAITPDARLDRFPRLRRSGCAWDSDLCSVCWWLAHAKC